MLKHHNQNCKKRQWKCKRDLIQVELPQFTSERNAEVLIKPLIIEIAADLLDEQEKLEKLENINSLLVL
jgi:hypothetical protein